MLISTQLYRQAIVMGEGESPIDPDPYGFWEDESSEEDHMPYNSKVLENLQNRAGA